MYNHFLDQLESFECFHTLLNYSCWMIKRVFFHQHFRLSFLQSEEIITCNFIMHRFQITKQNVYLLPENLNHLSNLNISFVSLMLVYIDITLIQLIVLVKLFLIATTVLHYLELIKPQLEHKVLYRLLQILVLHSQQFRLL